MTRREPEKSRSSPVFDHGTSNHRGKSVGSRTSSLQLLRQSRTWVLLAAMLGIAAVAAVPAAFGRQSDLPGVPEHPELLALSPLSQTNWIGEQVTHTATFTNNVPSAERVGVTITFTVLM